jgi:hypothetical protein
MSLQKWLDGIRLSLGFLLAPAIVSISTCRTLDVVLDRLGAHPDGPANIMLGAFAVVVGLGVPYCGTLCLALPYVIVLRGRGRLNLRMVMIATLIFSLVYAAVVCLSLGDMHPPHPLAEGVALPQVPAVIFSGLCFYLIGVWKLGSRAS